MSFKSLLLSKDTEVVQGLTRLLKDLDIAVEPCTEPFAAAKRLMDQHFDAILVDCEDEQGAGWVLQSARMAVASKKCVTIAIVGPHSAGRAPKGGENFVIQKPIVLKQAESTLRAARNLMGDGGGGLHPEPPSANATPAPPPVPVAAASHAMPTAQGRPPAEMFDELTAAVDRLGPQTPPARPVPVSSPMSSGAAAAPAPAWEKPAPVASQPVVHAEAPRPAPQLRTELSTPAGAAHAESGSLLPLAAASEMKPVIRPVQDATTSSDALDEMRRRVLAAPQPAWRKEKEEGREEAHAPRFSGLADEPEPARGFPFKAIAAAMVLVSLALFGYSWYRNHHAANVAASAAVSPTPAAAVAAPQPATEVQNTAAAVTTSPAEDKIPATATEVQTQDQDQDPAPAPVTRSKPETPSQPAEEAAAPETSNDSSLPPAPLVVSGGKLETSPPPAQQEAPVAPGLDTVAGASKPDLGGVVSSNVRLPQMAAPPQRVKVSQGVTEGLLVHQVTPQYPSLARESRVEGDVLLEAVIGKDGTVRDLRAISGPALLIPPAMQAVRQWRYKPYLLNSEPVEVETQIKLQFRL